MSRARIPSEARTQEGLISRISGRPRTPHRDGIQPRNCLGVSGSGTLEARSGAPPWRAAAGADVWHSDAMHFGLMDGTAEIAAAGYTRVPLASCGWRTNDDGEQSLFVTWPQLSQDLHVTGVGFFPDGAGGGPFFVWTFCEEWGRVHVPGGSRLTLGLPPGQGGTPG